MTLRLQTCCYLVVWAIFYLYFTRVYDILLYFTIFYLFWLYFIIFYLFLLYFIYVRPNLITNPVFYRIFYIKSPHSYQHMLGPIVLNDI